MFPTIDRLSVAAYTLETNPACEYFEYERGAFAANLDDEYCGWFNGHPPPHRVQFDKQASEDLAVLKGGFEKFGIPIRLISIARGSDGLVGAGSYFAADRCVTYKYEPGRSSAPEAGKNEAVTVIDANWYRIDICP
jgi:hypothetical protein